jgi:hypothetical protein
MWWFVIDPFKLKFNHLNMNSTVRTEKHVVFIVMAPKNPKIIKFHLPPPYKYPTWFKLNLNLFYHIFTIFFTHIISSSNSSKMKNQLTMMFQGVMEEVMSMLQAEEAVVAAASSSTRAPKRRR